MQEREVGLDELVEDEKEERARAGREERAVQAEGLWGRARGRGMKGNKPGSRTEQGCCISFLLLLQQITRNLVD